MKKKLIITESQYRRLINEQEDDYTEQLLLLINSNIEINLLTVKEMLPGLGIDLVQFLSDNINKIEPPYFYKFNNLGIYEDEESENILKHLFKGNLKFKQDDSYLKIYVNNTLFYVEDYLGDDWVKYEYDNKGNMIYWIDSEGFWVKKEYDSKGNQIYFESSDGKWRKYEYDEDGNEIYYGDSEGYWYKREYDEGGNIIYWENSDGKIMDNR